MRIYIQSFLFDKNRGKGDAQNADDHDDSGMLFKIAHRFSAFFRFFYHSTVNGSAQG